MIKKLKSRRAFKILHAYITNIELMKVNSTWKLLAKNPNKLLTKDKKKEAFLCHMLRRSVMYLDLETRGTNCWSMCFRRDAFPPASSVSSGGARLLYTSYSYRNGDYNNNLSIVLGISLDAVGLISCKKKSSFSRRSFDAAEKILNSWRNAGFVHVCHDSLS